MKRTFLKHLVGLVGLLAITIVSASAQDQIIDDEAYYPEGLHWDPKTKSLLYAEMTRNRVAQYRDNNKATIQMPGGCGPTDIDRVESGVVIACHLGGYVLIINDQGEVFARIPDLGADSALRNPNALASDGVGFYVSSSGRFAEDAPAEGTILYWHPERGLKPVVQNLHYANGVFYDAGTRRLFVSEHLGRRVWEFKVNAGGDIEEAKIFADLTTFLSQQAPLTGPDGINVMSDGSVVVAIYGASRALVFTPEGRAKGQFVIDERYITATAKKADEDILFAGGAISNLTPPFLGKVRSIPLSAMQPF